MRETYKKVICGLLIVGAVLGILAFVLEKAVFFGVAANKTTRNNDQCIITERVFDEADKLTDKEEEKLRTLIAKREQQIGADIVLLTINDADLDDSWNLRDYAQDYYEQHYFGWDGANGTGILYVDNWATGDCWLCTTGDAAELLDSDDIDFIIKKTNRTVNTNPYRAYRTMINTAARQMQNPSLLHLSPRPRWVALGAVIAALAFAIFQILGNAGKDTVTSRTYTAEGGVHMNEKQDFFLHAHVDRRRIEKHDSDGGGGGGGTGGHGGGGGHH